MRYRVVGLGPIAQAGKDSAFKFMSAYMECQRFAFADELKVATNPLTKGLLGIDSFTNNLDEKQIIRPILVAVGNAARIRTPRHWIEQIKPKVEYFLQAANGVAVVTDVRFVGPGNNEVGFIKDEMKGFLVHVDRIMPDGKLLQPANSCEMENYNAFKKAAHVVIQAKNLDELKQEVREKIIANII